MPERRNRVLAALAWVVALASWRALGPAGAAVGLAFGSALRIRRRHVEEAMRTAGVEDARACATAMYASLGCGALELLWLTGRARRATRAGRAERAGMGRDETALDEATQAVRIERDAADALDAALARGPVVVAATHTGNWELVAFAAARWLGAGGARRARLAVVAKPIRVRAFDAFCTELRQAAGLRVLAPRGALRAARQALAAGDVVAMPIDQVPEATGHGVRASFLGRPALVDRAPATLAARARATLVVVAAERDGRRERLRVLASIEAPPRAGRAWIDRATRDATAALEHFVRRSPASWLWLHRRWRAPKRGGVASVLTAPEHASLDARDCAG